MALLDILVGATGGLLQGAQDLRQRQLQDEQRQRQAALDQLQREQFDLQKKQFEADQDLRQFQNQVAKFNLTDALLGGLISGRYTPEHVRQYGGQMGLTLPEVGQRQVTREVRTEANRPSPNFIGPMPSVRANLTTTEEVDPLADLYDRARRLAKADEAEKRRIEAEIEKARRAWEDARLDKELTSREEIARMQQAGADRRASQERQYAPIFDTVIGGDGYYWTVNKRTGQWVKTNIKAPPRSSLDAFTGGDTEALAKEAIDRLLGKSK